MAVLNENQIIQQMIAQLRLLNPSYSAEVGTPERLIIEAAASLIANDQIDLVGLQNALNIDTKFGANLDNFVKLFGFARQESTDATGFVIFSRTEPATIRFTIPSGVGVQSKYSSNAIHPEGIVQFYTTASAVIPVGATRIGSRPYQSHHPRRGWKRTRECYQRIFGRNTPVRCVNRKQSFRYNGRSRTRE